MSDLYSRGVEFILFGTTCSEEYMRSLFKRGEAAYMTLRGFTPKWGEETVYLVDPEYFVESILDWPVHSGQDVYVEVGYKDRTQHGARPVTVMDVHYLEVVHEGIMRDVGTEKPEGSWTLNTEVGHYFQW